MSDNIKTNQRRFYKLDPSNFTENVWGGRWLPIWKKVAWKNGAAVGESWEFSTLAHNPSSVLCRAKHLRLQKILGSPSPFLIKFIDAQQPLSLQVHPDDHFAKTQGQASGKAENWIILNVQPGLDRGYVYLGFNPRRVAHYRSRRDFRKAFLNSILPGGNPLRFLNRISVQPGDIFDVSAGTIHSIGPGVQLFEIQQSSDITYRCWDWNRVPSRPLHLEKAMAAMKFKAMPPDHYRSHAKIEPLSIARPTYERCVIKKRNQRYAVNVIELFKKGSKLLSTMSSTWCVLTGIKGRAKMCAGVDSIVLDEGHSVVVLNKGKTFFVEAETTHCRIFKSYVP